MKKTLVLLAVGALLAMGAPALAASTASGCYDPNGMIDDSTVTLKPNPWEKATDYDCMLMHDDQAIDLPKPLQDEWALWGWPDAIDLDGDGTSDLDGTGDKTYDDAGVGTVFVLLGPATDDDHDVGFFNSEGDLLTFDNLKDGAGNGNTGGDEVGEVPPNAEYAVVRLWGGEGGSLSSTHDYFEVANFR